MADDMQPTIDVLLEGDGIGTDVDHCALCAVVLVEGPAADGRMTRILVDPAHVGRRTALWGALAQRGLTTDDIDIVVLTHAHWDHAQNVDVFAHAPLYLHPDEYQYSLHPHKQDWATPSWTCAMFQDHEMRDAYEGVELIPGVKIVDFPGHSIGSVGLAVENSAGLSIVAGDALHFAGVALEGKSPLVFWDTGQATSSIHRAVEMGDILYPGHDQPFSITKTGKIEYLYERNLKLRLPGTSQIPGVQFIDPAGEIETAALGYADPAFAAERTALASSLQKQAERR